MDRLSQIAHWEREIAELRPKIAKLRAEIEANPLYSDEQLKARQEKWVEEQGDASPNTILFIPDGIQSFNDDPRIEKLHDLEHMVDQRMLFIDSYERRELPDGRVVDEATFAQEMNLDLPDQTTDSVSDA